MEGGEFKKCCDCREAAAEQVKRRGEILISVVVPVYNAVRTLSTLWAQYSLRHFLTAANSSW